MDEIDLDDVYGENYPHNEHREDDSRVLVEYENVPNMNWEEFLAENMESALSDDESTYIASVDTGASSEDTDEEDKTSGDDEDNTSNGKKVHVMRSFKGKKHLYELEESSEEEDFEDHGFNTRGIDTSDEEFQMVRQKVIEYKAEVEKHKKEQSSEYEDSDGEMELISENEDDQDALMRRTRRKLTIGPKTDFKDFVWKIGLRFPNMEIFKEAVRRYGIYNGYSLTFDVCDKNRGKVGVICKNDCPFKIYASWHEKEGCILLKSASTEHRCVRDMKRNRQLTSKWLAKDYIGRFKENPQWPVDDMIRSVRRRYGVIMEKWIAYKARTAAQKMLHGSVKQHYNKLGRFIEELRRSNQGSTFDLVTIPSSPPVFQRFFQCFEGLRTGFVSGCRRFICLDGCFLKTFLGGILLAAVGRDGNNQMFPICWAVVEGENRDSWEWFLNHLKTELNETDGKGWTFMSDQQKGLLAASAAVFPSSQHRNCARHIYANWHKMHKGDELKLAFWRVVRAYTEADFEEAVEELKMISPRGAEDFLRQNPRVFCRAFFSNESKCEVVVSNMAETFNGYILKARGKHIIDMLGHIRTLLMERMVAKQKLMKDQEEDAICPRIKLKLEEEKVKAWELGVSPSSLTVFEVREVVDVFKVDIEHLSCTCKKWDITGIPCHHAIAAICFMKLRPESFVHSFYKKETYLKAYEKGIEPCVSEKFWPKVNFPIDPPPLKIQPGRPKKNRRKCPHEDPKKTGKLTRHGATMRCGRCGSTDHNIRRCLDRTDLPPPAQKKPRGRPRKNPLPTAEREVGSSGEAVGSTNDNGGRGRGRRGRPRGRGREVSAKGVGVYEESGGFYYISTSNERHVGSVEGHGHTTRIQASQEKHHSTPFNDSQSSVGH